MWEDIRNALAGFFAEHRCKRAGLITGMAIGIGILAVGFWSVLFVLACGFAGLYLGNRMDRGDHFVERLLKALNDRLPSRFQ